MVGSEVRGCSVVTVVFIVDRCWCADGVLLGVFGGVMIRVVFDYVILAPLSVYVAVGPGAVLVIGVTVFVGVVVVADGICG